MSSEITPAGSDTVVGMDDLTREECFALLAENHLGRVAVGLGGSDDAPLIRPVNYVFDDPSKSVAFRTADGSKLWAVRHTTHAAFEIDAVDPETQTGWSVVIAGVVEEVTNEADVRRLEGHGLETWVPGDRPHWVRVRAFRVSGVRLLRVPPPLDPGI